MKVYVVIHDCYSHDMIFDRGGDPQVFGVFSTRIEAQKHIRPDMDDYVQTHVIDEVKKEKK